MPHAISDRLVLSISEAHQQFGLSSTYLGYLLRKGAIDGIKIGSMWLIYLDSIEGFTANPRKPGPKPKAKPAPRTQYG